MKNLEILLIDRVPRLSQVHLLDLYILRINKASSVYSEPV